MKKFTLCTIITVICLSAVSCLKIDPNGPGVNPPTVPDPIFAQNFGSTVLRDFIIQIVDVANAPVQGASVKIGSNTTQSNAQGVVVIKNATVYEKFAYITAQKTGFINGSRAVVPTTGTNSIKIMMLPSNVTATVNTGAASNVNLPNGTKITFDGNFKTSAGAPYTGAVSVIVNHLDAADPDLFDKMPGMLFAKNAGGQPRVLVTYGMMNVELKGSAGQQLQIANTAQIELPITASQTGTAPATIPLWHFDEAVGYWKEDGVATKTGGKYLGTVKHFSWWNADLQLETILLKLKTVDNSGNPIPNLITTLSDSYPNITNSNGEVSGFVPKNVSFVLKIYADNSCQTLLSTQTIGPFATNTTLPNIVVNIPNINLPTSAYKTINGLLKKCDNSNVTNGYALLKYDGKTYVQPVSNGTFSFNILVCPANSFTIMGGDLDNNQDSGVTNGSLNTSIINVGTITTCQTTPQSISYSIDNGAQISNTANLTATVTGNSFSITNGGNMLDLIAIDGNSILPGIYTTSSGFQLSGGGLSGPGGNGSSIFSNFSITFNVLSIGAVGQFMDVAFNGTYTEQVMTGPASGYNINHSISGTAHVMRTN